MSNNKSLDNDKLLCPSFKCEEDVLLIGIIGSNGMVGNLLPALSVDKNFVFAVKNVGLPEQHFRFASICQEHKCQNWKDSKCSVITEVKRVNDDKCFIISEEVTLQKCSIRSNCRWFAQEGSSACAVCPSIFNNYQEIHHGKS